MPPREHTDPKALDRLFHLETVVPSTSWVRRAAAAVWRFVTVDLWRAPLDPPSEDSAVLRRIRIHEWATGGARRLRKLDRDEAAEVLAVTAMLLGFEESRVLTRRQRVR
jgi:hypothetical protein